MQYHRIQASVRIAALLLLSALAGAQSWNGKDYADITTQSLTRNGRNYYPQAVDVYCDFETGNDGDNLILANLQASCHYTGGTWSIVTTLGQTPQDTISTSGQIGQVNPKTFGGVQYTDSGGTRGLKIKETNQTDGIYAFRYAFAGTIGTQTSAFAWVTINLPNNPSAFAGGLGTISNGGVDFANVMTNSGNIHLETQTNPNGAADICYGSCDANGFFVYTPGTTYGIEMEFDEYPLPYHVLRIYSCVLVGTQCSAGALLNAQWKATKSTTPHAAVLFTTNFNDESSATGTVFNYMDGLVISQTGLLIIP